MPVAIQVDPQSVLSVGQQAVAITIDSPGRQSWNGLSISSGPRLVPAERDVSLHESGHGIAKRLPAGPEAKHDAARHGADRPVFDQGYAQW